MGTWDEWETQRWTNRQGWKLGRNERAARRILSPHQLIVTFIPYPRPMRKAFPTLVLCALTTSLSAPPMNRAAYSYSHPAARTPLTVGQGRVTAFNPDDGTLVTFAGKSQPAVLKVSGKWAWKPQSTPQGLLAAQLDFPRCRVVLWNLTTGKAGATLQGDFRQTFACGKDGVGILFRTAFTPDGQSFLATDGQRVRRWDVRSGKLLNTRPGAWESLTLSPDGKTVALLNGDHRIELWSGDLKHRLKATPVQPASCLNVMGAQVTWSGDSRLAAFSCQGEVRVWNVQAGGIQRYRRARTVEAPDAPVFSPDGRFMAAGEAQHGLTVWKIGNEVPVNVFSLELGHAQVTDIAVTKNNIVLAALSDGRLLHLEQGNVKTYPVFHTDQTSLWPFLSVNAEGTWFAMTDGRGKVKVIPLPLPDDWQPEGSK